MKQERGLFYKFYDKLLMKMNSNYKHFLSSPVTIIMDCKTEQNKTI